ncbi:MAG TPA: hypothetical protein VM841_10445 [Actinomycetota bacterium]|nr:hypothetical protein [Actinomycetota bacterium]
MNRARQFIMVAAAGLSLVAASCSTAGTGTAPASAKLPVAAASEPAAPHPVNFLRESFGPDSATITNPWWPLKPGTQWIWEGTAIEGEDEIERRVVFTVTDLTKTVAGIETIVGWDRDFTDGVLAESELIFLAQDRAGNVWHFGQQVERYDETGELEGGRTWLVGYLADAKAGIKMKANPTPGDPVYSQGFAPPPFYWDDVARAVEIEDRMCVPVGCYDNVLIIEEFEPTKPGAKQLKYYARGIGNIAVGWGGEAELEQEEMELTRMLTLSPAGMAEVREAARSIETRGNVYGLTSPLRQRPAAATASPSPSP